MSYPMVKAAATSHMKAHDDLPKWARDLVNDWGPEARKHLKEYEPK